jgi:hypothetical protein
MRQVMSRATDFAPVIALRLRARESKYRIPDSPIIGIAIAQGLAEREINHLTPNGLGDDEQRHVAASQQLINVFPKLIPTWGLIALSGTAGIGAKASSEPWAGAADRPAL